MAGGNDYTFQEGKERQQSTILSQLMRVVPAMHDLDELFWWLAEAIVQRYDVQLIQFWTFQINQSGQRSAQLRAMVAQDSSLPEQAVVNEQITRTVALISGEQSPPTPQPVEHIFPYYQASLLKRCGLNYCTHCSLDSTAPFPASKNSRPYERATAHLIITATLFLRQLAHGDPATAIRAILEQTVVIAEHRGLLALPAPPSRQPAPPQPEPPARQPIPSRPAQQHEVALLSDLIPRRKQDPELLMSSNPFTSPIAITDKQARRLHTAIDGHKNVGALCTSTGMDFREVFAALQILLAQQRIDLYEPGGRQVPASHLQKYR
jgi:hypothetical protein